MYENTCDDDVFAAFVENEKKAQQERENKKSWSGESNFEQIKYVGISKEHPTIVRLVGNFVEKDLRAHRKYPSDMKFMNISKVKGDDGKIFYLYLPLRSDEPSTDHLLWRIIDTVKKKEWVQDPQTGKRKPIEVNKQNNPEIYELVDKGGFTEADGKYPYLYAKGWKGSEMMLINCIDRRDDWCKANKHTKVLSKSVNEVVAQDGSTKEYAEMGVSAYPIYEELISLRTKFEKGWEQYDLVITKTGERLETKTNLFNGSVFTTEAAVAAGLDKAMGIDKSEYQYISQAPRLTEEELNYERYDLDKNFAPTSYRTIAKHLSGAIKKIDAALGTHFFEDLQRLVKEEAEAYEKERAEKAAEQAQMPQAPQAAPKEDDGFMRATPTPSEEPKEAAPQSVSSLGDFLENY